MLKIEQCENICTSCGKVYIYKKRYSSANIKKFKPNEALLKNVDLITSHPMCRFINQQKIYLGKDLKKCS